MDTPKTRHSNLKQVTPFLAGVLQHKRMQYMRSEVSSWHRLPRNIMNIPWNITIVRWSGVFYTLKKHLDDDLTSTHLHRHFIFPAASRDVAASAALAASTRALLGSLKLYGTVDGRNPAITTWDGAKTL